MKDVLCFLNFSELLSGHFFMNLYKLGYEILLGNSFLYDRILSVLAPFYRGQICSIEPCARDAGGTYPNV